jgi:DNA-binding transcriptional LysR family regulator
VRLAGYLNGTARRPPWPTWRGTAASSTARTTTRYGIWRFYSAPGGYSEVVKVHGMLSSNDGDIVLGWALDGHGILIRSEWDLARYLDSGRLRDRAAGVSPAAVGRPVRLLPDAGATRRARRGPSSTSWSSTSRTTCANRSTGILRS